ncbi:pilus assembly protein TadG-related protein [Methylobacterium sp. 77]|uniref:pilus assembly protein n=1 Tax=Methylobacterium sp. 77 TaxID=1101192 RepID=UPI0003807D35|nr:pilus assembly protein TadG-related protein [Methylobacterium sp. 77]
MSLGLARFLSTTVARLHALRTRRDGNVLIVFALSAVPMIGVAGIGIEYMRANYYRTQYDKAVDAATITAITTARDYISSNPNNEVDPTESAKTLAVTRGMAAFRVNAGPLLASLPLTPVLTVTRTANVVSATATYATTYGSAFGKVLGDVTNVQVAGKSASSLSLGNYTDFYLLLDTSGSMGFPTSSAAQVQFAKLNPDMKDSKGNNCAFACHFSGYKGYDLAKLNNIELRIKTVSNAVQQLIAKAKARQTLTNQYRIGLYPFVSFMETAANATNNLDSLTSIDLENYMDIGNSTVARGSGGTHYENILPAISAKITRIGDGSSAAKPVPYVFLITDGIGNNQYWYNATGWTGSQAKLLDPSLCTSIKNRGVTISVLYIPYVPLVQPYNDNVGYENVVVNGLIPSVPQTLQNCASPGFYRAASTASEIEAALNSMFDQATRQARLVP